MLITHFVVGEPIMILSAKFIVLLYVECSLKQHSGSNLWLMTAVPPGIVFIIKQAHAIFCIIFLVCGPIVLIIIQHLNHV